MPIPVERCVKHIKNRPGIRNAWAVCRAAYNKKRGLPARKPKKR
jgi:hypothetical protein